jgi:uncharacterized membrane protein
MLSVGTFSLSILVTAYSSAASTRLVMANEDAQNAIDAFIGVLSIRLLH